MPSTRRTRSRVSKRVSRRTSRRPRRRVSRKRKQFNSNHSIDFKKYIQNLNQKYKLKKSDVVSTQQISQAKRSIKRL